jgi:hypothetical protein
MRGMATLELAYVLRCPLQCVTLAAVDSMRPLRHAGGVRPREVSGDGLAIQSDGKEF